MRHRAPRAQTPGSTWDGAVHELQDTVLCDESYEAGKGIYGGVR